MDTILPSGGAAAPAVTPRLQVLHTAQGYITETWDRKMVRVNQILTDGVAYFMSIGLRAGDVCTTAHMMVFAAGTGVSTSKVGLYSKTGARLAVSVDQGTAWNSTGMKSINFITPATISSDDGYYLAVLAKTATTMPTLMVMNNVVGTVAAVGAGMYPIATQLAVTDLNDPATIGITGTPCALWMAVS